MASNESTVTVETKTHLRTIADRIDAMRATAVELLVSIEALAAELPDTTDPQILGQVRSELEEAVNYLESTIDLLAPRCDNDDPACCAIRALREAAAGPHAPPEGRLEMRQ